jgi:hypothetical protein
MNSLEVKGNARGRATILPRCVVSVCAVLFSPASQSEIYVCTDEYGNTAYQALPCPADDAHVMESGNTARGTSDDVPQDDIDEDATIEPPPRLPTSRQPGESLEDCKKRYRDQIDLIDAEMRSGFSSEQGERYKESLLVLTFQLRACDAQAKDSQ